ncbi:hypothetical protein Tco_0769643 [Tanacetum coccineum]|uniref:C3H1-type domain-containing protein n=1 Tax=Tanacetum coccineum TaxID=301880 RepID=A0ABQ4ZCX2_9ASTR
MEKDEVSRFDVQSYNNLNRCSRANELKGVSISNILHKTTGFSDPLKSKGLRKAEANGRNEKRIVAILKTLKLKSLRAFRKRSKRLCFFAVDAWKYGQETRQVVAFKEFKGGYVAFGIDLTVAKNLRKRNTLKTSCLDFEKVKLMWRSSSLSLISSRKNDVYVGLKNIIPLVESLVLVARKGMNRLWHSRLGIVQLPKNINKWLKAIWICMKIEEKDCQENLLNCPHGTYLECLVERFKQEKKYCLVVMMTAQQFSGCFSWLKDETFDMLHDYDLWVWKQTKVSYKLKDISCCARRKYVQKSVIVSEEQALPDELKQEDEGVYYQRTKRLVDKGTDQKKVRIMMKYLHQLPGMTQSDLFGNCIFNGRYCLSDGCQKVHFCMANITEEYMSNSSGFEDPVYSTNKERVFMVKDYEVLCKGIKDEFHG